MYVSSPFLKALTKLIPLLNENTLPDVTPTKKESKTKLSVIGQTK